MTRSDEPRRGLAAFVVAALAYSLLWLTVMPWYRYQLNVDGISYISIAQKYLSGDFSHAVNGYWSPLYSWLLVPLLSVGTEPLWAVRLLGVILGWCAFGVLSVLARDFTLSREARIAVAAAAVPVVLFFSLSPITPDLLVALLVLLYFHLVFRASSRGYGPWAGFVGGLAYLAKSYALPFFLAHFAIANGLHLLTAGSGAPRRRVLRNLLGGLLTFVVICGVWIALLSAKYGRFTYARAGDFNMSYLNPVPRQDHVLVPPANETAISAREDPPFDRASAWSPLRSRNDFMHYCRYVLTNAPVVQAALMGFSALSVAILAFYLLLLCRRHPLRADPARVLHPLVALVLFCGGYAMILVQARYIWVCCFLLLLMGGYAYDRLTGHAFFTRPRRYVLMALLVYSFAGQPAFDLVHGRNIGKYEYTLAQVLKSHIRPGETLASDTKRLVSMALAYHLHARYYGYYTNDRIPGPAVEARQIESDLGHWDIQHFLLWNTSMADALTLPGYKRVAIENAPELVLYSREKSDAPPRGE